jgi:lipopolysaccharide/colanic/teichoic acid biosynthesis glycosyltransferase
MGIFTQWSLGFRKPENGNNGAGHPRVLDETNFHTALHRERRRTERSHRPILLMLAVVEGNAALGKESFLTAFASAFAGECRETDILGWDQSGQTLGAVFTELGAEKELNVEEKSAIVDSIRRKVMAVLDQLLFGEKAQKAALSFHFFPEDAKLDEESAWWLRGERRSRESSNKLALGVKRLFDIAGSSLMLIALAPLLLTIGILVKFTSRGPALFRQTRIGQHGRRFTFLKFRSMNVDSDAAPHKEYVSQLIAGKAAMRESADGKMSAYKLMDDPRITPVGRFLRKSSLDELPQLLNVLGGQMSLVGPRPPLPYEFACYGTWHLRRIVEVKPGITGLWQVSGRSQTSFDEMVRLDLRYARSWSLFLDVKILLKTPAAVLSGDGAY